MQEQEESTMMAMEDIIAGEKRDPIDIATNYAGLIARKKKLASELSTLKHECDEEAEKLLLIFQKRGIARLTVAGQTLYPYARTYLSLKDKGSGAAVAKLLEEAGLGDAVVLGTQRLTSVYNEDPEAFPPSIAELFAAVETWYVGARKSN